MGYTVKFQGNIVTNYQDIVSLTLEELRQNWEVYKDDIKQKLYFLEQGFIDKEYNPTIPNSYYYVKFGVYNCPDFILSIEVQSSMTEKHYLFLDDVYEGDEFVKISFVEKSSYIDVISDVQDYKQILEKISQYCKNQPQYLFDKYSGVNVTFPPSAYTDFYFKLNNISGFLDVYLYKKYVVVNGGGVTEQIEKMVSFKIYQVDFFDLFWFGMFACLKENQCNISAKNATAVPVDLSQVALVSDVAELRKELLGFIRAITTLPDPQQQDVTVAVNNNAVLKLEDTQLVKLVDQLSVISQALIER